MKVVMPAAPQNAKGFLVSVLQGTGPVILLGDRALYEVEVEVPEELGPVPFGKRKIVRLGKGVTIETGARQSGRVTRRTVKREATAQGRVADVEKSFHGRNYSGRFLTGFAGLLGAGMMCAAGHL